MPWATAGGGGGGGIPKLRFRAYAVLGSVSLTYQRPTSRMVSWRCVSRKITSTKVFNVPIIRALLAHVTRSRLRTGEDLTLLSLPLPRENNTPAYCKKRSTSSRCPRPDLRFHRNFKRVRCTFISTPRHPYSNMDRRSDLSLVQPTAVDVSTLQATAYTDRKQRRGFVASLW